MTLVPGWFRLACVTVLLVCSMPAPLHAQFEFDGIPFIRGDSNGDRLVDISDGVATLSSLFLGNPAPECGDAADANDSGTVDIADAIYTFSYLFLGGPPPPAPGPFRCGCDRTRDGLLCNKSSCTGEEEVRDFSDFSTFQLRMEPLCGLFFSQEGRVVGAAIERAPDGTYSFQASVLQTAEEGCLPEYCDGCFVTRDLPERVLTENEAQDVLEKFSAVQVRLSGDPLCSCFPLDPEGIRYLEWDTLELTDDVCSDVHVGTWMAADIEWLLQGLSAP